MNLLFIPLTIGLPAIDESLEKAADGHGDISQCGRSR